MRIFTLALTGNAQHSRKRYCPRFSLALASLLILAVARPSLGQTGSAAPAHSDVPSAIRALICVLPYDVVYAKLRRDSAAFEALNVQSLATGASSAQLLRDELMELYRRTGAVVSGEARSGAAQVTNASSAHGSICEELPSDPIVRQKLPAFSHDDYLQVFFEDSSGKKMTIKDANLTSIKIMFADGVQQRTFPEPLPGDLTQTYAPVSLHDIQTASVTIPIQIAVTFGPDAHPLVGQGYFLHNPYFGIVSCVSAEPAADCDRTMTNAAVDETPYAKPSDSVRISFEESGSHGQLIPRTLRDVDFDSVAVSIDGNPVSGGTIHYYDRSNLDTAYLFVPLIGLADLAQGTTVQVHIATTHTSVDKYLKVRRRWVAPGMSLLDSPVGIWIPFGLFATNFKSGSDGLPLNPSLVGVALGTRYYFANHAVAYIGGSLMFNWQTVPGVDDQGKADGSYKLEAVTIGPVLDFGDYWYLGGAWTRRYTGRGGNPGWALVFGPGPSLLSMLKLLKPPT